MTLNKIIKSESCLLVLALHHMNQRLPLFKSYHESIIFSLPLLKTDYLKPTLEPINLGTN